MLISEENIIIIIILCINTCVTIATPFINSLSFFIKNISKSECCGSSVQLKDNPVGEKEEKIIEEVKTVRSSSLSAEEHNKLLEILRNNIKKKYEV